MKVDWKKEVVIGEGYIRELIPPTILAITGDVKYIDYNPETYSLQFEPLENEKVRSLYIELENQICMIECEPSSLKNIVEEIKRREPYAKINELHPDTLIVEANPLGRPPHKILNLVPKPLLQFNPAYDNDLTIYKKGGKREIIKAIYFVAPVSSRGYDLGIRFFSVSLDPKPVRTVYLYVIKSKRHLNRVIAWIKRYAEPKYSVSEIELYYRIETQMLIN